MKELTKVIFKNAYRRDNVNKDITAKILSAFVFVIIFGTISSLMAFASYRLTNQLIEVDQAPAFINIILLIMIVFLFSRSVFESLNNLYFSKDLKIFLRMPIKPLQLVKSKIKNMIVSEYLMELMLLASPIIVYGIIMNVNYIFYIYSAIILLLLPIIPIVLTSLITATIMRFTNVIKNKTQVQYITVFIIFVILGIITSLFSTGEGFSTDIFTERMLQVNGLIELISDYFVILKPIMNSLLYYQELSGLINIVIFAAESIICYYVMTWLISKVYLKGAIGATINGSIKDRIIDVKLKPEDFKPQNSKIAYLSKELKQIIRTPIFCMQCIIFPVVFPVVFVGLPVFALIAFARSIGLDFLADAQQNILKPIGVVICICIAQVLYIMNFTSITAISREGKSAKLMKTIPIGLYNQFRYKLYPGLISNGIIAIIITAFYGLFMPKFNFIMVLTLFVVLIELCLLEEKIMVLIDLNAPKITWTSEYTMMKENVNVMYEFFYAVVVIILLALTIFVFRNSTALLIFLLIVLLALNALINRYVRKNQAKLYKKVY